MNRTLKSCILTLIALAIIVGGLPITSHAATSKPAKVTVSVKAVTKNSVTIKWKKQTKKVKGFVVYRFNPDTKKWQSVKKLGKAKVQYKDTKLKAGTTYKYRVRAFNKVKVKGKTKYVYGAVSKTVKATTKKGPSSSTQPSSAQPATSDPSSDTSTPASESKPATDETKPSSSEPAKPQTQPVQEETPDAAFAAAVLKDTTVTMGTETRILLATSKSMESAVKWSISDTSIATLEKTLWVGTEVKITPKKEGTATITATNWDGQTKSAKLTVKAAVNPGGTTGGNTETPAQDTNMEVTGIDMSSSYFASSYPYDKSGNMIKSTLYLGESINDLYENSYFVFMPYVYPNSGENRTKPVTWTVKENTIGATIEKKDRNLIVKTPVYSSKEQFNGRLIVELSVEGHKEEYEFRPIYPILNIPYADLLGCKMTPDVEKQFLWPDVAGEYSGEIKDVVASVTAGCKTNKEKAGKIIEWFHENIEYKSPSATVSYTWQNKGGVCAGISCLLAQMFRYADIPAGAFDIPAANHSCTALWLDGEWYSTDGTDYKKGISLINFKGEKYIRPMSDDKNAPFLERGRASSRIY